MILSIKDRELIGLMVGIISFVDQFFPMLTLLASLSLSMIKDGRYFLKEVSAVCVALLREDVEF